MIDFMEELRFFEPRQNGEHVDVTLPVVMRIDHGMLDLRLTAKENYYLISCPRDLFYDRNREAAFYFDRFVAQDPRKRTHGMQLRGEMFYRKFENDYSPTVAIANVVRFFVLFEQFVMDSDILTE